MNERPDGWQPIETLDWRSSDSVLFYQAQPAFGEVSMWFNVPLFVSDIRQEGYATHWMPAPEPPEDE